MSDFFKTLSNFLATIKGVPIMIGLILVIISLIAQFLPVMSFLTGGQWLLHLGIIIALIGILSGDIL